MPSNPESDAILAVMAELDDLEREAARSKAPGPLEQRVTPAELRRRLDAGTPESLALRKHLVGTPEGRDQLLRLYGEG